MQSCSEPVTRHPMTTMQLAHRTLQRRAYSPSKRSPELEHDLSTLKLEEDLSGQARTAQHVGIAVSREFARYRLLRVPFIGVPREVVRDRK